MLPVNLHRMHTLQQLERGALAGAQHVRLVNLGLTAFPPQLFALADTLEILDLSGNALTTLPDDLHRLHKLRILFCSNNPFTQLPAALGRCGQLEMVGFKACALTHVPAESLPPRLRWLILTDNRLTALPQALGQRPRLQKLMLSCNQLAALPDLSGCPALELLRIASNRFEALPPSLLALPALRWPALAGNPLTAAPEAAALAHAHHTALSYDEMDVAQLLGEGASGHIFRATHRPSGRALAVKVFKAAATSDGTPQSELAAGLAAGQHPHLLTPMEAVKGHPQGCLATALPLLGSEYIPLAGPPSFASCTRDVYDAQLRICADTGERLLAGIESALAHLHARGVLHGDLYAHNILWNPQTGHALLSDLGAAMLTATLPAAQVAQLQQIERRAWATLQAEVRARY